MRVLEGQAEALAGTFIAQGVANTLWAYATMGWEPGARERVLFILVLNLVSSTPPCILQPGPRIRVLGVCDFV